MGSRIAIIDLGTNTFHLLIVDVEQSGYHIIYREREAVKVGKKGINKGFITEEALQRALAAVSGFKTSIDQMGVTKIHAFGTSALRNASNQKEIIERIRAEHGIDISIISGEEEARLIYLGVRAAVSLGIKKSLIIDIGGGSVEFIIGNESEVFWKQSFEIGAQRLLEEYHKHDPISSDEIKAMHSHLDEMLGPLFTALKRYKPDTLVGSSGTFDTLSDIFCIKNNIMKMQEDSETPLTFSGFNEIYEELLIKDRKARMQIPGMIELRVDMIVVACSLIDFLLARYSFKNVRVSSFALKEGVLADLMETTYKK